MQTFLFNRILNIHILLIIPFGIFGLIPMHCHAQTKISGLWMLNESTGIEFLANDSVYSKSSLFLKSYNIDKDTLTFKHDYTAQECYTIDSAGNRIERKDWKLPDSKFLILENSDTILKLVPYNPSAMKLANNYSSRNLSFNFLAYQKVFNKVNGLQQDEIEEQEDPETDHVIKYFSRPTIDTLVFYNSQKYYYPIKFDSISFSTFSQGWFAQYYFDLKLYSNGEFVVRRERVGPDSGEFKGQKIKLGTYNSKITDKEINDLNEKLSVSGIGNTISKNYVGWTSHGKNITIRIYHDKTYTQIKGIQSMLPILLEPVIDDLLQNNRLRAYDLYSAEIKVETSYLNKK